jgi:hypothetical protein
VLANKASDQGFIRSHFEILPKQKYLDGLFCIFLQQIFKKIFIFEPARVEIVLYT